MKKSIVALALSVLVWNLVQMGVAEVAAAESKYQFYPEANVYFDGSRQGYFFQQDGQWTFGVRLPDRLKVKLGDFEIIIGDNKPYRHHEEHIHKYRKYRKKRKKGPPDHAPAHGYRRHYRYYPDHKVYYDVNKGSYVFFEAGNWRIGLSLPGELQVKLGSYIVVSAPSDAPYVENVGLAKRYPPGKWKKARGGKTQKNQNGKYKKKSGNKGKGKGKKN